MKRIEDIRKTKGFTQEAVAEAVGIATSSYNQYETGARNIPADIAKKIADVLGVETGEIFLPIKFTVSKQN